MCGGPPRVSSVSIDQYLEEKRMCPRVSPGSTGYRRGVQCHGGVDWSNRLVLILAGAVFYVLLHFETLLVSKICVP